MVKTKEWFGSGASAHRQILVTPTTQSIGNLVDVATEVGKLVGARAKDAGVSAVVFDSSSKRRTGRPGASRAVLPVFR